MNENRPPDALSLLPAAKAIHEELGARCSHDPLGDDCWYLARAALAAAAATIPRSRMSPPLNETPDEPPVTASIGCVACGSYSHLTEEHEGPALPVEETDA